MIGLKVVEEKKYWGELLLSLEGAIKLRVELTKVIVLTIM